MIFRDLAQPVAFTSVRLQPKYEYFHVRDAVFKQHHSHRQMCTKIWINAEQYGPIFIAFTDVLCKLEIGPGNSGCRNALEVHVFLLFKTGGNFLSLLAST